MPLPARVIGFEKRFESWLYLGKKHLGKKHFYQGAKKFFVEDTKGWWVSLRGRCLFSDHCVVSGRKL